MSYWATLGLPGAPLSAAVEDLARWVQWAFYGIGQGVSGTTRLDVPLWRRILDPGGASYTVRNEDLIRYNLTQFWNAKGAALDAAQSEEEKRQIYRLDMMAHGALEAVASGKVWSASPEYLDFWTAFLTGGSPDRNAVYYAAEAKQAAEDAAEAARAAGLTTLGTYFEQNASNAAANLAAANAFWNQPGTLNVAGVSWWVWIAAGVGVYLLVKQ